MRCWLDCFCALLLAGLLVQLTRPDGAPIWVAPGQVVSITQASPLESRGGRCTSVQTAAGLYGVHETPAEVLQRFKSGE